MDALPDHGQGLHIEVHHTGSYLRNNSYDMWVQTHNDPSVMCRDASPSVVSDNAGDIVSPSVEVKA